MKKILILLLALSFFSCKKEIIDNKTSIDTRLNPNGIPDSLIVKGAYFVSLNEAKFMPILVDWNESLLQDEEKLRNLEMTKFSSIRDFALQYDLKIPDEDIFIYTESGFFIEEAEEEEMLNLLKDSANVASIEPDFLMFMQNTRARMQSGDPLPQTTRARMQNTPAWGYDTAKFTSKAVLYLGGGTRNPNSINKIWIIDSGIDSTHQDLKGLFNEELSDYFMKNVTDPDDKNPFFDFWGHGTSCAGLAAAVPANIGKPVEDSLIGMTGVSPGAQLVSLKVFGSDSTTKYTWIRKALEHAGKSRDLIRGDVVSMSLGAMVNNCANFGIKNQIRLLTNKGAFVVVAAGNGPEFIGVDASTYLPACVNGDKVFTIGSMDLGFTSDPYSVAFSEFSNFKTPPIDWLVPGNYIFTTYPDNEYAVMQGTSMSTALMAGLLHLTNGTLRTQAEIPGIHGESYTYPVPIK